MTFRIFSLAPFPTMRDTAHQARSFPQILPYFSFSAESTCAFLHFFFLVPKRLLAFPHDNLTITTSSMFLLAILTQRTFRYTHPSTIDAITNFVSKTSTVITHLASTISAFRNAQHLPPNYMHSSLFYMHFMLV